MWLLEEEGGGFCQLSWWPAFISERWCLELVCHPRWRRGGAQGTRQAEPGWASALLPASGWHLLGPTAILPLSCPPCPWHRLDPVPCNPGEAGVPPRSRVLASITQRGAEHPFGVTHSTEPVCPHQPPRPTDTPPLWLWFGLLTGFSWTGEATGCGESGHQLQANTGSKPDLLLPTCVVLGNCNFPEPQFPHLKSRAMIVSTLQ